MKKNKLGHSDIYVSEIGLGCMSLGTDEKQAISIIHKSIEQGVNYLDTADLYDQGLNEEFVGKAVSGKRDQVIIGTKVGNHWESGKEGWYWDPSKGYIKEAVKASLKRLNTDYIDLYQLHGGTIEDPIDETIEAFEELVQEGVIRYYGISSIRPNVIREYVKRSNLTSVMMQYSMLDRRPEEEILPLLAQNNISVIARGPVAKGLLSANWKSKVKDKGFLDYNKDELEQLIPLLQQATELERPLHETALRYCLQHPAVATVIPGASNKHQIIQNTHATEALQHKEYKKLQSLLKANTYEAHR